MVEILSSISFPNASLHADHGLVEPTSLPSASARNDGALLAVLRQDRSVTVFRGVLTALNEEMECRWRLLH